MTRSMCVCGVMLSLFYLSGCSESQKASHFEHDHIVAEHWPEGLEDLAVKLRERLAAKSSDVASDQKRREEIADLVGWTAEIAADTDLGEVDWIPLDNAAEALASKLHASKEELDSSTQQQAMELCAMIESAAERIPETPEHSILIPETGEQPE